MNLRTKLLIPAILTALLAVAGIVYISILQYQLFRHQTEHRIAGHKQHLHLLIGNLQEKSHDLIELLSNKWRFLDSLSAGNMDILLNEITPFHKNLQYDFIAVYDMDGITIARGDSPSHFGMSDDLYEHIMKAKKGKARKSIVTLYDNKLLLLELKRLETSYRPLGFLAVGQYLDEKTVNTFVRLHQLYLAFQYKDAEVAFSNNSILPANIDRNQFRVEFIDELGQDFPLSAILWEDTSKIRSKFWNHLFTVIIALGLASCAVIYFSRRIVVNTVNALDKARASAERELSERKKAEEALKHLNEELEERVQARTQDLEDEIIERKQAKEELNKYRDHLEELVEDRTDELKEKTDKIEASRKALTYLVEDVNKAREELEKANEKLKELDQLKSMFIASMSHELRTPLNSIIGFTGIILQGMTGEISAEQRDQLQRVYGSAKHLLNLITDIIDISKIEAGKVEVYAKKVTLNGLIKEAVSTLKPEIDNKGLGLEISLPPDLQLTTDRKRLLQCILNFLSNAVKFTEKGKIEIAAHEVGDTAGLIPRDERTRDEETSIVSGSEATGHPSSIVISVADTGVGIKKEDIPKLFKSFVRLDTPLKTVIPGTGLGLYLTKKLATEVLKGSVSVESKYGEGSMFVLRIPKEIEGFRD